MVAPPLLTDKEASFLQALVEEGVDFVVVGLAAAALQGVPAVTQDIDLWFRDLSAPALQRALRRVGATYIPPSLHNPPLIAGADLGLFDVVVNVDGLGSYAREARRAVRIPLGAVEVRVLPLDRIIASKRASDRPKDRAILPALEDALRVLQSRKRPTRRSRTASPASQRPARRRPSGRRPRRP